MSVSEQYVDSCIVLTLAAVWDTIWVLREVFGISRWRLVLNLLRFSEVYP